MASPAYFSDPSKACSAWHVAWSSGCLRAIARYFSLVALSRSANSLRILSLSACSLASWKRLKSSWRLLLKSSSTALICSATLFSAGLDGAGGASLQKLRTKARIVISSLNALLVSIAACASGPSPISSRG